MKKMDIFKRQAKNRQLQGLNNQKPVVSADLRGRQKLFESGKISEEVAKEASVSPRIVEQFMFIEKNAPEKLVNDLCEGKFVADENGKQRRLSIDGVYNDIKRAKAKAEVLANLKSIEAKEVKATQGVYDVVVIDPPWPIEMARSQSSTAGYLPLLYPIMSLEIPCADDCYIFLWTTQKSALRLKSAKNLSEVKGQIFKIKI